MLFIMPSWSSIKIGLSRSIIGLSLAFSKSQAAQFLNHKLHNFWICSIIYGNIRLCQLPYIPGMGLGSCSSSLPYYYFYREHVEGLLNFLLKLNTKLKHKIVGSKCQKIKHWIIYKIYGTVSPLMLMGYFLFLFALICQWPPLIQQALYFLIRLFLSLSLRFSGRTKLIQI